MTEDRARLHTAVLVAPSKERRKLRKQRRKAEARLHAEQRRTAIAAAKAKAEEERAERRATVYLPRAGEPGAARLRTPGRFHLTRHQDTSATLAGAYPFVAEGGLGADGVFVGQDLYSGGSFVYDPWVLYARGIITAPNVVLAGIVGSGKSSLAKSLYTRSLPFRRRVYVPGDPKGEHTAVANAVGGRAIVLGHGLNTRLNPLDEGHRPSGLSDQQWASTVAARRRDLIGALAETVLARGLSPLEHTAIDIALTQTVRENDVPILPMVVDRILAPSADADGRLAEDGRLVGHALRRLVAGDLAGLFDGPSTVAFDPSLPMISLDLSRVTENSTLISVLMTCSSAWMESALLDPNGGQRWVIYDEAWRLMSHPALLRRMDAHWRLARHYGIANMLIFHKLTDLDNVGDQGSAMRSLANSLLANAETRIVYRQESDQLGPTATALGLTGTEQQLLPNLGVGQGLWRIKARSFVCQHQLHPGGARRVRHQQPRSGRAPMNLTSPRRSGPNDDDATAPVELPHVLVTVAEDGTLAAMVDGTPFASPDASVWTRATFGPLMDAITKDRTIAVRVEVRENDGSVFTDILRTRKPRRAVAPSETPGPETRRSRHARRVPRLAEVTAGGFVPGEDVAVATIVSHTDATGTGETRTLVDLDDLPDGTHEVILFGRISGTIAVRRLT